MMEPGIQISNSLVLLVQGKEIGKLLNLVLRNISCLKLGHSFAELVSYKLLTEPRVMVGQVNR